MGDVPADHAPATVDTLFRLAREAVKRQIASDSPTPHQPAVVVTVPRPQVTQATHTNGNGDRKRTIKDPSIPASPKQIALLKRLAREKGEWLPDLHLTMGEASAKIDELMALPR